jgi:putative isomerase
MQIFPLLAAFVAALLVDGVTAQNAMSPARTDQIAAVLMQGHGTNNVGAVAKLAERLRGVNHDIEMRGVLSLPNQSDRLITGYAYGECYDWDLYFENIYLSYYGITDFCFTNFSAFLANQQKSGFIPRMLKRRNDQMFKPFLAQIAVLGSRQRGDDFEWLRASYYDQLGRYIDCWMTYDFDRNGLPVWESSDASGMDNQKSRSGELHSYRSEGVDLACELHREMRAMAVIAGKLGNKEGEQAWTARADKLAACINSILWDEKDGFYYDRDERTGKRIRVKSVAGFFPIWAGIASPYQARRLIMEHLTNPSEFWTQWPVSSYALTEPDFYQGSHHECNWRGPAWVPTNYMIMHGLMDYGYNDIARDLADRTFRMALFQNPATREYYDSDTARGNGMNPFWGWSSLAYVMPYEAGSGYDPMSLNEPVHPLLKDSDPAAR